MQKSENKIKPAYYGSDGYEEYGVLSPDPKKIKEEEFIDEKGDEEFLFEPPILKISSRRLRRKSLKRFLKSKVQRALRYARYYRKNSII